MRKPTRQCKRSRIGLVTARSIVALLFFCYLIEVWTAHAQITLPSPGYVGTVAGGGSGCAGYTTTPYDNCAAINAQLHYPFGVAVDASGNIYIADDGNNRIRRVDAVTTVITTVAGNGIQGYSTDPGLAISAELNSPDAVAFDASGNLYISDTFNNVIRMIPATTGSVYAVGNIYTVVGGYAVCSGRSDSSGDGCPAIDANLYHPGRVTFDGSGNMFIADAGGNRIHKVAASTGNGLMAGYMYNVAGGGTGCIGELDSLGDGCSASSAILDDPGSVALDASGNIYIADFYNHLVREVYASGTVPNVPSPQPGYIYAVAGNGTAGYAGDDGLATSAELYSPQTLAIDSSGNIYVSDTTDCVVRKLIAATGKIYTVAGNGVCGTASSSGLATVAELYNPYGIGLDASGNLYIANDLNERIRVVVPGSSFTPAIAWATPAAITYGTALSAIQLNAIVNVTSSCVYTPALGTVLAAGTQTLSVTCTPSDTTNYVAATTTVPLTVSKAPLTVTANNASRVYGVSNPTFTASYSGFVNGDTSSVLTGSPSLTTTATTSSPVGTYTITAAAGSLRASNYTFSYVNGTFTINQATPTITWSTPSSITYGTALSSTQLDASLGVPGSCSSYTPASGSVPGAGTQVLSVTCTPTDTTDYTSPTGTVSLTVNNAPLTVTANNATWVQNVADPAFTASYSGFVNGDTTAVLSGSPSLTTTATLSSAVGSYTITAGAGTLSAANYSFSYVNGALSVILSGFSLPSSGNISTIAGTGSQAYGGDSGPATSAWLSFPYGEVIDAYGNVYIDDDENNRIRVIYSSGTLPNVSSPYPGDIYTAAGGATPTTICSPPQALDSLGDGCPANKSILASPRGIGIDPSGNIYIADTNDNYIRAIYIAGTLPNVSNPQPGNIYFVAGTGTAGFSGDGGSALSAKIDDPMGFAFDASGDVYFSDSGNNRIREVNTSTGNITTVAGNGTQGYSGIDVSAISAELNHPYGLAFDGSGNLYIADHSNHVVRAVYFGSGTLPNVSNSQLNNQYIYTVAGNGTAGSGGDDASATASSTLSSPDYLALSSSGAIYVSDAADCQVRELIPSTGKIYTVVGNGTCGNSGDGGMATSAELHDNTGIAFDAGGNLYISDLLNEKVRVVGPGSSGFTQTITWAAPMAIAYGTALSATQLNATPEVTSTCVYTPALGTVLTVGAHTLSVTCTPSGTSDFSAGTATVSLSVSKAPLTVTANNASRAYNTANPTFTASYSGFVNGDTSSVLAGLPSLTTTAITSSAAGTYMITAAAGSLAASNYSFSYANGTLTINQTTPTISVASSGTPSSYGSAVTFTATVSSGLSGTTVTFYDGGTAIGTGTVAGTTATFTTGSLAGGTHTIAASLAASADYGTATSSSVSLVVNKVTPALSIAWSPTTLAHNLPAIVTCAANYGGQAVTDGTILGFTLNGTSEASGPATSGVSTWTPSSLPAGTQTIGCTAGDTNYNSAQTSATTTVLTSFTADSGTVTLTVGGVVAASTTYGNGATPSSIAEGLAANVTSGSYVNVSAVNDTVYIEAKPSYTGTDYSYSIATTNYDTTDFSQPSFAYPALTGTLEGASNSGDSQQTVYNYSITSYDPASNVTGYSDSVMGTWTTTRPGGASGYDTLNRLANLQNTATTSTSTQYAGTSLCWAYDSFGNRTAQQLQTAACPASETSVTASASYSSSNQITWVANSAPDGFTYDDAGNVIFDNANQYLYDEEGRICAVKNLVVGTMTGYLYDAEGSRVAKGSLQNITSCDPAVNGFQVINEYSRDLSGEQWSELDQDANGNLAPDHANAFANGQLFATLDPNGWHFYLNDWLGTRRVQTDSLGTAERYCTSLLYGDGESCPPLPTEQLFTGKERDAESGNDYFGARYYSSAMGRFMSPDWSAIPWPVPYSDLTNPQSLNLYVYGADNPLRFRDLDGHWHQECGQQTSSTNANGDTVVNANCSDVADFWDYQWWGPHVQNAANHAWNNTRQTWNNAVKFAHSPRGKLLGKSLKHLTIGGLKAGTAVGGIALAPETGGASLALTAYGTVGATGDLTAGTSELLGSIFGSDADIANISNAGDAVAAVTTVSGATTLVVTGGNVDMASHAASIEDIVVTAGTAGLTGEAPHIGDWLGLGDDTNDLSSPGDPQQ